MSEEDFMSDEDFEAKTIAEQRSKIGIANRDVWNLYSYLEDLADEIVPLVIEGSIPSNVEQRYIDMFSTSRDAADHFKNLFDESMMEEDIFIFDLGILYDETERETMTMFHRWEALEREMNRTKMAVFHRAILPTLPLDEKWEIPEADRRESLMSEEDFNYAGSFYVKNAVYGVNKIQNEGYGNLGFGGEEESERIRNRIIDELKAFEQSPHVEALNRFCYHFEELWD